MTGQGKMFNESGSSKLPDGAIENEQDEIDHKAEMKKIHATAGTLPEKPVNPGAIQITKCPEPGCGKPYKFEERKIGGAPILFPIYQCDCREKKRLEWEREEKERTDRERFDSLIGTSRIPQRCKDQEYEIPEEAEYLEDNNGDVITNLQYDIFYRMKKDFEYYMRTYPGIFVPGNPGTRKTTYVCEIAKQAMRLGRSVRYYQCAEIITNKINIWELVRPSFLILDDVGNDPVENRNNIVWTLVNKRIDEKKFTAIVTNFSEEHNKVIFGEAFIDRLKLLLPIVMIGESSRKIK